MYLGVFRGKRPRIRPHCSQWFEIIRAGGEKRAGQATYQSETTMGGYDDVRLIFKMLSAHLECRVFAQEKDAGVIRKDEERKSCYAQHSGKALAEENLRAGKE